MKKGTEALIAVVIGVFFLCLCFILTLYFVFLPLFDASFEKGVEIGYENANIIVMETISDVNEAEDGLGALHHILGGKGSCDYAKRILLIVQERIEKQKCLLYQGD